VIFCVLGYERLVHYSHELFFVCCGFFVVVPGVAQVGVFLFEDCGGDMADMAGVWGMYIIC
jgi:hypothetical protein